MNLWNKMKKLHNRIYALHFYLEQKLKNMGKCAGTKIKMRILLEKWTHHIVAKKQPLCCTKSYREIFIFEFISGFVFLQPRKKSWVKQLSTNMACYGVFTLGIQNESHLTVWSSLIASSLIPQLTVGKFKKKLPYVMNG